MRENPYSSPAAENRVVGKSRWLRMASCYFVAAISWATTLVVLYGYKVQVKPMPPLLHFFLIAFTVLAIYAVLVICALHFIVSMLDGEDRTCTPVNDDDKA